MIDKVSFAMDDTRLFLDTHPDCKEAIMYFKKMEKLRNNAIREYEMQYGPILAYETAETTRGYWDWNKAPLPWNNMNCGRRR
jgi:spore coat protein JB